VSEEADRDAMYREHARRMVENGLTDAKIGHEIVVSYDEVDRYKVRKYVLEFQEAGLGRPTGPEWIAIVRAYRATRKVRPSQEEVADKMGSSERTLVNKLRDLHVDRWDEVHALVATED
jgi:hypothetical protein